MGEEERHDVVEFVERVDAEPFGELAYDLDERAVLSEPTRHGGPLQRL